MIKQIKRKKCNKTNKKKIVKQMMNKKNFILKILHNNNNNRLRISQKKDNRLFNRIQKGLILKKRLKPLLKEKS